MLNEPACNALYTADYVLTQNAGRDVIRNGAVAVAGDRICCVGHTDMLEILYPEARRVDLGCAVILPGLINSHTHVSMSLLRGYSDDKALMDWLQQDIFPREAKLTPELVELGALFSFAEMLRTGTTAFFDMYMLSESVVRAADRIGMRGLIGESVTQYFPSLAADSFERYCDVVRGLADRLLGHKRLRAAVLPHAPYTTTPQMLRDCHALARELDLPFGMHLAETQTEVQGCREAHGLSPVAYCRSLGLLQPNSTFFHTVYADEDDIQMLAEGRCAVVHNPASNMKLASGHAPVEAMRRAGIPVSLGTDGPASNNAQNLFRDMYVAALIHKGHALSPTECPAQFALDMATRNGAAALHDPYIGSLEPGMRADFIALDLTGPNMQPVHNILSNTVYAATGMENKLTVVDGQELYRDGRFLTCDYEALCSELRERVQAWMKH